MSNLHIEILTPPSPYQTYLQERLQSARGLGWAMPERSGAKTQPQAAEPQAATEFTIVAVGTPA